MHQQCLQHVSLVNNAQMPLAKFDAHTIVSIHLLAADTYTELDITAVPLCLISETVLKLTRCTSNLHAYKRP